MTECIPPSSGKKRRKMERFFGADSSRNESGPPRERRKPEIPIVVEDPVLPIRLTM